MEGGRATKRRWMLDSTDPDFESDQPPPRRLQGQGDSGGSDDDYNSSSSSSSSDREFSPSHGPAQRRRSRLPRKAPVTSDFVTNKGNLSAKWSGTAPQLASLNRFIADMDYLTRHATWFFKYHMLHPRGTPDEAEIPDVDFFRTLLQLMNNFGEQHHYNPTNEKFQDIVDELTPQLNQYVDIADFWPPQIPANHAKNAINYAAITILTNVTVSTKMNLLKKIEEYVRIMKRVRESEAMIKALHRHSSSATLKARIRAYRQHVGLVQRLATDPEQSFHDPAYYQGILSPADITILEGVWAILPEQAFNQHSNNSRMQYDIELHPEQYFESYVKLSMMFEAAKSHGFRVQSFNAVPLRAHYYQSYVAIDTLTLAKVALGLGQPKISTHYAKMQLWRQCFNLDHSSFHPRGKKPHYTHVFQGNIETDGFAVSVRLKSRKGSGM
ncbi:hypothetical protein BDZ88DRAFT_442952 [Geranomyces variabilis]|nr:hypothetical protein BDZ88DRAFT_442952 [Geranomyces variabilis]KAJ3130958.1 hypothetical protein HDU90_000732 [Geranomyces variabilis]